MLVPGGRVVFSVFHPDMAAAGVEAKFVRDDVTYRLGAERHRIDDYVRALDAAGFEDVAVEEHLGDEALVAEVPAAGKCLGLPLLLVLAARSPTDR